MRIFNWSPVDNGILLSPPTPQRPIWRPSIFHSNQSRLSFLDQPKQECTAEPNLTDGPRMSFRRHANWGRRHGRNDTQMNRVSQHTLATVWSRLLPRSVCRSLALSCCSRWHPYGRECDMALVALTMVLAPLSLFNNGTDISGIAHERIKTAF